MAKKNFQSAPKPANTVSLEAIEAFEKGGVGKDTRKPAKSQNLKPTNVGSEDSPVYNAKTEKEATKRLSVDLPQAIHTRFKTACSATGRKMVKEIEDFIRERTEALEEEAGITRK